MSGNADAGTSEKRRIKLRPDRATESFFGPFIFPTLCRHFWPENTAAELASIGGARSTRTAEFWLSGTVEAPPMVHAVLQAKIIEHDRKARAARR
jgi:hypothetical protein